MDAPTLSAFAAAAAAIAAGAVALVQYRTGSKQADAALLSAKAAMMNAKSVGRHTVAAFRQNWINTVIDSLCEYHSILMTRDDSSPLPPEDNKKLSALGTKLELLLNPTEPDAIALLKITDEIFQSTTLAERRSKDPEMVKLARKLLKTEWVRIKDELK